MARALIVGCGCRGLALASCLLADGHAVRATTRRSERLRALASAGVEPLLGDPGRLATLMDAIRDVTVVCWLMGTPCGDPDQTRALHAHRLRALLERLVDSPVRGVVYEAAGSLEEAVYARGRQIAAEASATWSLPVEVIAVDPARHDRWLRDARAAVGRLLTPGQRAR